MGLKKLSIIVLILILAACSVKTITDERTEPEINTGNATDNVDRQQLDGTEEQEYIKISKDDAPKLWNEAGVQLWKYVKDTSFAEENGWKQGSTSWRKFDNEFDKSLSSPNQTWQNPGKLLLAFMTDVEVSNLLGQEVWEINSRIELSDDNNAEGYIMSYGLFDDSIAGIDIKLTMKRENEFWYIESVEEREQCWRGVADNGGLCI